MQCYCRLVMKKSVLESGLISLQLDSLVWETAIPRTHKPQNVNDSLEETRQVHCMQLTYKLHQTTISNFAAFSNITNKA